MKTSRNSGDITKIDTRVEIYSDTPPKLCLISEISLRTL